MIQNGSILRNDAANVYLENIPFDKFSDELFAVICTEGNLFSAAALTKYLIEISGRESKKLEYFKFIASRCKDDVSGITVSIRHLEKEINCNIVSK